MVTEAEILVDGTLKALEVKENEVEQAILSKKAEGETLDAQNAEKSAVLEEKTAAVKSFQTVKEDFRVPRVFISPKKREMTEAVVVGAVFQAAQNEQNALLNQQEAARLREYEDELLTKENRLIDEKRHNEERVKELVRREVKPLQEQINTLKAQNNSLTTENKRLSKDVELLSGQRGDKLDKLTAEFERFKATAKRLGHLDEIEEYMRAVPKARGHGDR
jgi:chromosome segregation ATPase